MTMNRFDCAEVPSSTSHNRILYLDVAKGLAILLVIAYHVPLYVNMRYGMLPGLNTIIHSAHVFLPFFMPVFFVVSGFFLSTKKKYLPFLWSEIIHLLMFTLLLQIINTSIQAIGFQNKDIFTGFFALLIHHPFHIIFSQWFIAAIFFARQIYYVVDHLVSFFQKHCKQSLTWLTGFLLLLIACVGVWIEPHAPANNYLFYCQGLVMSLYLFIGQLLKRYTLSMKIYGLIGLGYIFTYALCSVLHISIIEYGMVNTQFNLRMYPLYLCLAISGSILLLFVALLINHCKPLEFLGRHSLMCYVPQGGILYVSCYWFQRLYIPSTPFQTILLLAAISLLTIFLLVLLSALQSLFQRHIQPQIASYLPWHPRVCS